MDDSFMSTGSFDDDNFICMALDSENQESQNAEPNLSSSATMKAPSSIDISTLLSGQLNSHSRVKQITNDAGTPLNSGAIAKERKRKNITRRCLSNDLSCDFSLNSDDEQMSFQEFRNSSFKKPNSSVTFKSNNILSSIENTISPKSTFKNSNSLHIELTPEFNTNKKPKRDENHVVTRLPVSKSSGINSQTCGMPLQKCFSENHASIMRAVQKSVSDSTLIGDFSKPYGLPLLPNSKHQDLKSISCHVLFDLLNGKFSDTIESFAIVDCRYPYEFDGGHIKTAINLYTQELVLSRFIKNKVKDAEASILSTKRNVLIFHCEFSSERGPGLCRFLRNRDRVKNSRVYPCLHYPEMYLLEGGYKEFYTNYSNHCQPCSYLPMHSKEHEEDLRKFRSLVKSHSFDTKFTAHKRNLRL